MSDQVIRTASETLLKNHLCDGVRPEDLQAMFADCEIKKLSSGTALCREGDAGDSLFIVLQGEIKVLKRDPRGEERELAILSAPALLGHMSLVDGSSRSATCLAHSPTRVVVMSRAIYEKRIADMGRPGVALRRLLLSSLTQQLVRGNAHLNTLLSGEDTGNDESDSAALLKTSGILQGWTKDAELNKMLDSMEVVQSDADRRIQLENAIRRGR